MDDCAVFTSRYQSEKIDFRKKVRITIIMALRNNNKKIEAAIMAVC